MQAYLAEFLNVFDYPPSAREALLAAYGQIMAVPEAAARFAALSESYDSNMNLDHTALIAEMTALCDYTFQTPKELEQFLFSAD